MARRYVSHALAILLLLAGSAAADIQSYPDPCLDFVYPAGARQGQSVEVELGGTDGLAGAQQVLVEGPPGVSVSDVKAVNPGQVRAVFTVAADAVPGRRLVRVLGGGNGLTNYRYFFVGRLPEAVEKEENNSPATAQEVAAPCVVNGRLDPTLDVDCFRFQGRAGQPIVAAVLAHGMDSKLRISFNLGFLDTSLELLDDKGAVLAAAEDSLGLDPLIHFTLPADGWYTVRVQALSYKGSKSSVYRLTLGDVPYPTSIFPAGGRRGSQVQVELAGPNVPPGIRQTVSVPADDRFPLQSVSLDGPLGAVHELPFVRGDFPESVEQEPLSLAGAAEQDETSRGRDTAAELALPSTVNGRFDRLGDEDWFRFHLKQGQGVLLQTEAQRLLGSPVDTALEVHDASGKLVAENDDGAMFGGQCLHDFVSADSRLLFTAAAEGDYFVRLRDQTGAGGPLAVYRLTAEELRPDFQLFQWPDAVPVWGAGTTAAFVVQVFHWGGMKSDIAVRVEGLPAGWTGSVGNFPVGYYAIMQPPYGLQVMITITAPPDAAPGTLAPFRVVGRAEQDGRVIEHEAQCLTLYGNSHNDRMWLRPSALARAVVAGPLDCWLETSVKELTVQHGGTVEIPVTLHRRENSSKDLGISVDGPTVSAGSGWRSPLTLKPDQNELLLPLQPPTDFPPGTYPVMVSRAWAADIRGGRPGPCTPVILLHILPKQ